MAHWHVRTTGLTALADWAVGTPGNVMDDEEIQDYLAEYFAAGDEIPEGAELVIRRVDGRPPVPWEPDPEMEDAARFRRAQFQVINGLKPDLALVS